LKRRSIDAVAGVIARAAAFAGAGSVLVWDLDSLMTVKPFSDSKSTGAADTL
jgi:hypothetical protein